MNASIADLIDVNHRYWQSCRDTHVASPTYYQRVRGVLPLLCELHLERSYRVLDVGCGDGEYTAQIARHCAMVEGIDLSETLIARAAARGLRNAVFVASDAESLSRLPDACYDAIFAMGVFSTLHGYAFGRLLDTLGRLLRAGGTLITRDSVSPHRDIVRRVNEGYTAHYRSADNMAESLTVRGLNLRRAVYLDTFGDIENYFFVSERVALT